MNKKIIFSTQAPAPIGPYSQGVMAGNTVYLSGQIAYEASLLNDIEIETKTIMESISLLLKEADMGYENIVKTSIFLKNMDDFAEVNKTYGAYFTDNFPARETVQVSKLPRDVNVEISVIAVK